MAPTLLDQMSLDIPKPIAETFSLDDPKTRFGNGLGIVACDVMMVFPNASFSLG
jgi:hypothetical protein